MSDPVYLYGHGSRRHIADATAAPVILGSITGRALCGGMFRTEEETVRQLRYWATEQVAERRITRARSLPVCKFCERAYAKAGAS